MMYRRGYQDSAFNCTRCHSGNDLPLEEQEHDERQDGDDQHVCEEQIPSRAKLAHETEQGQLGRDIFIPGQKIERPGEIVIDTDRGGHNDRNNGRL